MARTFGIGTKLLITYLIILIVAFTTTGIIYHHLSQKYLLREAKQQLRIEGQAIAKGLANLSLSNISVLEKLFLRRELKIAGRFLESKIIVFNKDGKILYTNWEEKNRKTLQRFVNLSNLSVKGYVGEKVPIISPTGEVKGYIFLMTKLKEIQALNRLMKGTRRISFLIAGAIALVIGMFFQRKLTKPLKQLMNSMMHFSLKKDTLKYLSIKTGDEIEDLAVCFRGLVEKLKQYDIQQKQFLQNTSHELKTPLMSIQGYAEAIKDGIVTGKELEESLDIIINESQRLKKIVDEIIYLTKLENVEETFQFTKHTISELIEAAVKSIKPLVDEKRLKIKMDGDFNIEGLFDEEKMKRAFINILSNSIRYAKEEICIQSIVKSHRLEIWIADDGEGFRKGEEKQVFERFYKGKRGNTGLGLTITRAIVEGHGGKIYAENGQNKGAVIKICLPQSSLFGADC